MIVIRYFVICIVLIGFFLVLAGSSLAATVQTKVSLSPLYQLGLSTFSRVSVNKARVATGESVIVTVAIKSFDQVAATNHNISIQFARQSDGQEVASFNGITDRDGVVTTTYSSAQPQTLVIKVKDITFDEQIIPITDTAIVKFSQAQSQKAKPLPFLERFIQTIIRLFQ